jgi:hypothetical protein
MVAAKPPRRRYYTVFGRYSDGEELFSWGGKTTSGDRAQILAARWAAKQEEYTEPNEIYIDVVIPKKVRCIRDREDGVCHEPEWLAK